MVVLFKTSGMSDVGFHVIGQLETALNFQIKVKVADGYYFCAPSPSIVWILEEAKCLKHSFLSDRIPYICDLILCGLPGLASP